MKKSFSEITTVIVALLLCLFMVSSPVFASSYYSSADYGTVKDSTSKVISNILDGEYGEEWYSMDLARDGKNVSLAYYDDVKNTVIKKQGSLEDDEYSYTKNAKAILALTAGGYNAETIGDYNLLSKLADYDAVVKQGINGPTYALLALDSGSYDIPTVEEGKTQATREKYVQCILDMRLTDSGLWAYSGQNPDVDMTSMVITALAPYKDNAEVNSAIENALTFISDSMDNNGTLPYIRYDSKGNELSNTPNCNSTAVAVWALCANGINPNTDTDFIKNGRSLLDGLLSLALKNGGFGYSDNKTIDYFATQQAYEALIAYDKLVNDNGSVYKMFSKDELKSLNDLENVIRMPNGMKLTYTGKTYSLKSVLGVPNDKYSSDSTKTVKNVGKYVLDINANDGYIFEDGTYSSSVTLEITKATPSLKISAATKTVKYSRVRKKAQYTSAIGVSNAKGTKTFYKTAGSSKLSVNKKTGKILVKKKTKRGTYKIKVKVLSAATTNYKAVSKTAIIKVKVK